MQTQEPHVPTLCRVQGQLTGIWTGTVKGGLRGQRVRVCLLRECSQLQMRGVRFQCFLLWLLIPCSVRNPAKRQEKTVALAAGLLHTVLLTQTPAGRFPGVCGRLHGDSEWTPSLPTCRFHISKTRQLQYNHYRKVGTALPPLPGTASPPGATLWKLREELSACLCSERQS